MAMCLLVALAAIEVLYPNAVSHVKPKACLRKNPSSPAPSCNLVYNLANGAATDASAVFLAYSHRSSAEMPCLVSCGIVRRQEGALQLTRARFLSQKGQHYDEVDIFVLVLSIHRSDIITSLYIAKSSE